MAGVREYQADQLPSEEYREWRLCTLLHKLPSELADESALRLDWLLAVDTAVTEGQNDAQERAARA